MAKGRKGLVGIAVIVILVIIAVGVFAGFTYNKISKDINGDAENLTEYTLVIESSDFQYDVSIKLAQNGIIVNDTVWSSWMDKHYPDFEYINGEYNMKGSMSYEEIAQKLQNPDISHKTITVCIPEGYTVFDIADTLEKNGVCSSGDFLEACKSKDDYTYDFLKDFPDNKNTAYQLEGFLFPATYDLAENTPAKDVVSTMLETFDYKVTDDWISFCNNNNMSLYELITLASIVEKETLGDGVAQDIASVFINRLNIGQQLQSDVTIFYGNDLRENGFNDSVVESYNTYKCKALPSGPVCNPGVENINAVVNHNDTEYYYFYSDLNQQFHFAKDYNEFLSLMEKYPWQ